MAGDDLWGGAKTQTQHTSTVNRSTSSKNNKSAETGQGWGDWNEGGDDGEINFL